MLKHYIKIAGRNLWRNKGFSAITIFGLAIGLATCLLITLFIVDELSYDKYNVNADQIYRVDAHIRVNGSSFNSRVTPASLGPALLRDYPAIENMVRIRGGGGKVLVTKGNQTLMEPDCFWADSTLFDVFTLPMISGNPKTALTQPHSIVLSRQMALKYFNSTDVVGKTLLLDNTTTVKITGVIEDMPAESHLHFHFIRSMSGLAESRSDFWLNNNFGTYVLARPGTDEKTIDHYLQQAALKYAQPQLENLTHNSFHDLAKDGGYFEYKTIPLTKIHLYSTITTELEPSGNIQYVYIFIVIAIIVLLIACVNFTNLSTARSAGRSREVGIRKVMGSQRSSLVSQFLTESILTSFLAMGLAVLI
ncbi:MAG TPA: ABC transporter permease, partial [Chitinophagaceae bacterium]|nr:ABC transporter permease [Chitinophagaceae bacterium]